MLPKLKRNKKLIYLDYAATTPIDPEVLKLMHRILKEEYGNPSSLYDLGDRAKDKIEEARAEAAGVLNCKREEIIFTAGGTESINLAIQGVVRPLLTNKQKPHIITTAIEHPAVLETARALKEEGAELTELKTDQKGRVDIRQLLKAIKKNTVLVSVMHANNEIGTIQPIEQIGVEIKKLNKVRHQKNLPQIALHSDACQSGNLLELDVQKLSVDLLTLNSSKVYGPKQVGLLYIKTGTELRSLLYGGGQERGLRSGTENLAGILGFTKALSSAQNNRVKENKRLLTLSSYLHKRIKKEIPGSELNGPALGEDRLTNNLNISFKGLDGEAAVLYLSSYNIAVSTGSACSSIKLDPSHVILQLGKTKADAQSSLRFTLGKWTTKAELDYLMKVLPGLVKTLRETKGLV
jgi:cysteine desulfurase